MRVVLDTNVLVAAFITPHGASARALKLWAAGNFELVTSSWQIEELCHVGRYDHIKERINAADLGTLINNMRRNAFVVESLASVDISPDPDDNSILAAALATEANFLVTGDKSHLLFLGKVRGVRIITVRDFVAKIG